MQDTKTGTVLLPTFNEYPAYQQPPRKASRSDAALRKHDGSASDCAPTRKHGNTEQVPELCCDKVLSNNDSYESANVGELLSPSESSSLDINLSPCKINVHHGVQVSYQSTASVNERHKWKRRERHLKSQRQRIKCL